MPSACLATLSLIPLGPRSLVSQLCSAPSRESQVPAHPLEGQVLDAQPGPQLPAACLPEPVRPRPPRPQGAALTFPYHRLQPRGRHLSLGAPPLPGLSQGGGVAPHVIHVDPAPRGRGTPPAHLAPPLHRFSEKLRSLLK